MFEKEAEKWTIDYVCKDCSRYKEYKSKEHCTCKECSKENKVPKYENYMRGDIELLINCDAIYLLENWGTSKGARLEKKIAEVLKMQIMTE